jgi:hypothetical protein
MYLRLCVFAAVIAAALIAGRVTISAAQGPAPAFEAGEAAYIATKFDEARALYAAAAASTAVAPKDRASALRQLGVMAWRLDGDNATAERRFGEALAVGADVSRTQAERARFLSAIGRFDEAASAGEAAIATASNAIEQSRAALAYGRAVLDRLRGVSIARQTKDDQKRLARARDVIAAVAGTQPLPLDVADAWLETSLRLDDGPLALTAWRAYAREGAEHSSWADAGRRLGAILPRWTPRARTQTMRNDLVEALRASRFYDLAVLIATDERFRDAGEFAKTERTAELILYTNTLAEIRAMTDACYRDIANRKGDGQKYVAALMGIVQKFWSQLHFEGAPPPPTEDNLVAEFAKRFGAVVNAGRTGGVQDLHFGHIFIDEARAIEQYGRSASIRLVSLDRLVSNGYESWVWDGRQAHGGWASDDRIVQVRPSQADGAFRVLNRMFDPAQRAELEQKIATLTTLDETLAKTGPAVFLPGLAVRLEWQGNNAILDRLKARGLAGEPLKSAFMIEQSRIKTASSIDAHEGRHVLDKLAFPGQLSSEELEFRAKLSEVVFCEEPRVAFGSIFNANMGDPSSPHGRANKRVAEGVVSWMDSHRAEIKGLDPARPLLPQFDKLTDDQMRAAMRAMDPWAPKP